MTGTAENEKKKFNIPPIALVITAVILLGISIVLLVGLIDSEKEIREFRSIAKSAHAEVLTKTVYTSGTDDDYTIHYIFDISFNTNKFDWGDTIRLQIDETSDTFKDVDIGQKIDILYDPNNPYDCRPEMRYPNNTFRYILLALMIIGSLVLGGINLDTLLRNIHGYTPKYTKPDEIGTMGDASVDNGLSDNQIDYGASDSFSDHLMDSYSDPFATYSGYDEENAAPTEGNYYDPNQNYSGYVEPQPSAMPVNDIDLNNPFNTVNNDPNNPYNAGSYEPQPINSPFENYDDPFKIYGDGSFNGNFPQDNSSQVFGEGSDDHR